jgi:hypothetical protein
MLAVSSAGFVGADPAAILLDTDTLAFTRVNDSILSVALPDLPGNHELRVSSPRVHATALAVHLAGYVDAQDGPVFSGRAVRASQLTELFGSGPQGLRRWNVSTGQTWDYPDSLHQPVCSRGVGLGAQPGELVLHSGSCSNTWKRWRVEPILEARDTTPWMQDRFVDVLAGGLFVRPGSHEFRIDWCDTACTFVQYVRGESGFDVVHSPSGDRAVPLAYVVSDSGAPVVDVGAKAVGYFVPPFQASMGAVFSENGDTLFLVGRDSAAGGVGLLAVVRAADGTRLTLDTTSYAPCGIALDPVRPVIYVAGLYWNGPDRWSVLGVVDRATLEPIVTLRVGDGSVYGLFGPCLVLPSPAERRIYVVTSLDLPFDPQIHASVARFETPPY